MHEPQAAEKRTMPRVLRLGLFDHSYPRNRLTAAALAAAGAKVRDLHCPALARVGDRLLPAQSSMALWYLGYQLVKAEVQLLPFVPPALHWADSVLFGYPGQWDVIFWAQFARRANCAILFDPLVTLTETFVEDRQVVFSGSWRARWLRWLDRRSFQLADWILADTPYQAAYWAALSGLPLTRFFVLPVGADETVFAPRMRDYGGERDEDSEALRLLFYGTYSPLHGAETIVEAVAQLERAGERVKLVMIGSGQRAAAVRELARALTVKSVTFIDWVPERELAHWIAWADVVLGIFGPTAKAARVVPNKVYQAMAMAACVVTRDSPAMRWLLKGEEAALLVPPGDARGLAEALRQLRDPWRREILGRRARACFEKTSALPVLATSLRELLSSQRVFG